ncbi:MAG: hypothetical protein ABSA59_11420 [Terriglobia bacterium]|jgi:hypothetical protein
MKGRTILVVAAFIVGAFALGTLVGLRLGPRPRETAPIPRSSTPAAPAASSPPPCVDIRNAESQVGKSGCVAGLVLRVYSARTGNTFLDFCQDYRTCPFSSVIFASDKDKFGDLGSLQGKRVEIRGDVVTYQGRAEIIIRDSQQVRSAP